MFDINAAAEDDKSMQKTLIYTLLGVVIVAIFIFFIFAFSLSTEDLIMASMPRNHKLAKFRGPSFMVLKHLRGLSGYSYQIPPITFALNGCIDRMPKDPWCIEVIDWMIDHGQDVNQETYPGMAFADHPQTGMSPIHTAVLACSAGSVDYLISKNANLNLKASQGKIKGETPLSVATAMQNCPEGKQMIEALKKHGAVDKFQK
jgi:hypothetical protein